MNVPYKFAATHQGTITAGVNVRSGPGTNHSTIRTLTTGTVVSMPDTALHPDEGGCSAGWYRIFTTGSNIGFVCSNFISIGGNPPVDTFGRPWLTPKQSIVGGTEFLASRYIARGQFTLYLKKYKVNPASRPAHTHQYMANLRAPFSQASTVFNSYSASGMLDLPLVFSIPVYRNMPVSTHLADHSPTNHGTDVITNLDFENYLIAQGFPPEYRSRLRVLHAARPNWIFQAMDTGLDFHESVMAQKLVSSIDSTNTNLCEWRAEAGGCVRTEPGWFFPTYQAQAYFLDPRNFLDERRIMQFEKLAFSDTFSESHVQHVLNNTFMSGISVLDHQSFASIFMEAGRNATVNPVYLASLARQEVGVNGSSATTGNTFTYNGITYTGLYNFFNIGALSSSSHPAHRGLVWAAGNSMIPIVSGFNPIPNALTGRGYTITNEFISGVGLNQTVDTLRNNLSGFNVVVTDAGSNVLDNTAILGTGNQVIVSNGEYTSTFTIVIMGDLTGTGNVNSADLLRMRQHLLGQGTLQGAFFRAADLNGDGNVNSADLLFMRQHLLGQRSLT